MESMLGFTVYRITLAGGRGWGVVREVGQITAVYCLRRVNR